MSKIWFLLRRYVAPQVACFSKRLPHRLWTGLYLMIGAWINTWLLAVWCVGEANSFQRWALWQPQISGQTIFCGARIWPSIRQAVWTSQVCLLWPLLIYVKSGHVKADQTPPTSQSAQFGSCCPTCYKAHTTSEQATTIDYTLFGY